MNKGLLITTLAFFLLVNTGYYWEAKTGLFAIPIYMLFIVVYLVLVLMLVRHVSFAIYERPIQKNRVSTILILATVVSLTYFKPQGIIDFQKFDANDVLFAEREGSANCFTSLKLKEDYTFRKKSVCFSIMETKGTYRVEKDTVYFETIEFGRDENKFYKYAVIKPSGLGNKKFRDKIVLYHDKKDTLGLVLWITKNDLKNLAEKSKTKSKSIASFTGE